MTPAEPCSGEGTAEAEAAGNIRFARPGRRAEHVEHLRQLDEAIATAETEIARLVAEHERLQARRSNANANAALARDYLMQR